MNLATARTCISGWSREGRPPMQASFCLTCRRACLCWMQGAVLAPSPLTWQKWFPVLKPGGLVGIRDRDYSLWFFEPVLPGVEEARRLALLVAASNGASPTYARQQRHLLIEAGFPRVEASASCVSNGTLEQTKASARALMARLRSSSFQETVVQQGWSDAATLEILCAEVQAWGERPDAFEGLVWRAAVGRMGTTC